MFFELAVVFVGAATVIALIARLRRTDRDGKWHWHVPASGNPSMRRYVNRRWEYREMTEAESEEYQSSVAW